MGGTIRVRNSDWLYNCGILGLYNVLTCKAGEKDIELSADELVFPQSMLDGFSEKYFYYLIDTYEKTFSIYRITSFRDFLNHHENDNFKYFNDESLKRLNAQIDQTKKYMKSNSYTGAYSLIHADFDPIEAEKKLKKIYLKKKEQISEKLEDIKAQVKLLKDIIDFFELPKVKRYIAGKNAMYSIISNAWDNISLLNPQVKNPDMYDEFESYFVKSVNEYKEIPKNKYDKFRYRCISCNHKIKSLSIDLGFMREVGFDVNRKTSHVWDFNNYVAICPVCRLVYACVPAGFTYLYNRGVFINYSMDLRELVRINNRMKNEIMQATENNTVIYRALHKQMDEKFNEDSSFELSDIQVVRFKRGNQNIKYTFNILNKPVLITAKTCSNEFERIRNASFKEGDLVLYVYNEVMKKLLNNENQFLLIYKLIRYKLSMPEESKYSMDRVEDVLKINMVFLKEAGYMEKDNKNVIRWARMCGVDLQTAYDINREKGNKDEITDGLKEENDQSGDKSTKHNKKLYSIAYRMLNALRTDNKHSFMDIMIHAHMYAQREIPIIFTEYLDKDLEFKNIGYAFVTGMLGSNKNVNENTETNKGGQTNE